MLERLIISNSNSMQTGREWYFLFSSTVVCIALIVGLVISLFSKDVSLGAGDFELVQLIAPVEPAVTEPEPPIPDEPPEQPLVKERRAEAPTRLEARPTRQVNMARLNETPPAVPQVSTRPNTQAARPANKYFEIGKVDLGSGTGYTPARTGRGGQSSGSSSNPSVGREAVAGIKKPVPPPPPRIKKTPKKSVTRSLGVINGNARSLPRPKYPAAARAVRALGKVNVRVLINENGRVVSVNAVSGHPLLRNAAEAAAREARFSPTLLSGVPVKVSGVIVYNFLG